MTPTALESERETLGGLLQQPELLGEVLDVISPADMHAPQHRDLLAIMTTMASKGLRHDLPGTAEYLERTGSTEIVGGVPMLIELSHSTPAPVVTISRAKAVKRASVLRRAYEVALELQQAILSDTEPQAMAVQLGEVLGALSGSSQRERGWAESVDRSVDRLAAEYEGKAPSGISTGWIDVDDILAGGLRPGELTILAARPAMGKTATALNWLFQIAERGEPVGFFSMEMPMEQLIRRSLPRGSMVSLDKIMRPHGGMSQEDFEDVVSYAEHLKALPLYVDERGSLKASQVRARVAQWVTHGVRVIFLDYLGKMWTAGKNRTVEVGQNVSELKAIAKDFGVAFVALHQLSRECEKRKPPIPMLSDLRDSGEVEQEADTALFLYRPAVYDELANPRLLELHCAKMRMGRTGHVDLEWDGALQRVSDADVLGLEAPHAAK